MPAKLGSLNVVCIQLGPQKLALIRSRKMAPKRGSLSTTPNGNAVGTKVNIHYRQGGL